MTAASAATARKIAAPPTKVTGSKEPTPNSKEVRRRPIAAAARSPTTTPAPASFIPWMRIILRTFLESAPSARRTPISEVR